MAYAIIGLSFALLSMALEVTVVYQHSLLVEIIDALSSGALFPALVVLFIANQVDHPLRRSTKRWWLFVPHLASISLSVLDLIFDSARAPFMILLLFDLTTLAVFVVNLVFIPGVLIYAYPLLKRAGNSREKRWLTQLWYWVFIMMTSWVLSIVFFMFSASGNYHR
ncbi:MAG: hypothetical protein AAF597_15335 [Bacteroidota bacterium]